MPPVMAWIVLGLTGSTLAILLAFAAHRTHLLLLTRRSRPPEAEVWTGRLPRVTVQIPVYNEAPVVARVLDAAARLDYPRDLLQVQLLDDSTDETSERAARRVSHWRREGVQVEHLRRKSREGFKAGALDAALADSTGEFILVLDADFVPDPDLVRRLLPPFQDPGVGMVQARWGHLNEDASLLTRCQALLLDAHFFFEQGGRYAGRRFMNFNGTAGMWRRTALEEAGGWSWDTLTEDLDLSYRCQMAGWRFVFLEEVEVLAEIPEGTGALETQQKRWSRGGVQTARKILPRLLTGPWPGRIKVEGVVHLLGHVAHPLTLLLAALLLPSAVARRSLGLERLLVLDLLVFLGATVTFVSFYAAAGRRRGRPWRTLLPRSVATLALGVGLGPVVSRAVIRGLMPGDGGSFVRTPKRGDGPVRYRPRGGRWDRIAKGVMLGWMVLAIGGALSWGYLASLPFLLLFGVGYLWMLTGGMPNAATPAEDAPILRQAEPWAGPGRTGGLSSAAPEPRVGSPPLEILGSRTGRG
jgi:cellulose synthase/poly-beta-1,6-N-acetylglucosamine synthase-like glycosyltransferase